MKPLMKQTNVQIIGIEYQNGNKATVDYLCTINGFAKQIRTIELTETDLAVVALGQNRNYDWRNNNETWEAYQFTELYPEELEMAVRCATHSNQVRKDDFEVWATPEQVKAYNEYFGIKSNKVQRKTGKRKALPTITHRVRFRLAWWNFYSSTLNGAKAIGALTRLLKKQYA